MKAIHQEAEVKMKQAIEHMHAELKRLRTGRATLGLHDGERVLVTSNSSGARLETYVIRGKRGSGVICMNGAAAHLIKEGEEIIIMGFELSDAPVTPSMILVDKDNTFLQYL